MEHDGFSLDEQYPQGYINLGSDLWMVCKKICKKIYNWISGVVIIEID